MNQSTPDHTDHKPATPESIERDIERTRQELGDTVEALAAKADVRKHARDRAEKVRRSAKDKPGPWIGAGVAVTVLAVLLVWRRRRS